MCTPVSTSCSCSSGGSSSSGLAAAAGVALLAAAGALAAVGPGALIVGAAAAVAAVIAWFKPTRVGAWWLLRRAVFPALAFGASVAALWIAGKPFTPAGAALRTQSGATWLRAGGKVAGETRTGAHWYAWAGWQRTAARIVMVVAAIAAWLAPYATAGVVGALLAIAAARIVTVQVIARRNAGNVRTVRAVVGTPLRPAALIGNVADGELLDVGPAAAKVSGR